MVRPKLLEGPPLLLPEAVGQVFLKEKNISYGQLSGNTLTYGKRIPLFILNILPPPSCECSAKNCIFSYFIPYFAYSLCFQCVNNVYFNVFVSKWKNLTRLRPRNEQSILNNTVHIYNGLFMTFFYKSEKQTFQITYVSITL